MEKEEWINEVLNSTSGMQKAEPGPFLFEKITARIEKKRTVEQAGLIFFGRKWALGLIAVLVLVLVLVNGLSIFYFSSPKPSEPHKEIVNALSHELGYSSSYNY
jgi:hypothetical protein